MFENYNETQIIKAFNHMDALLGDHRDCPFYQYGTEYLTQIKFDCSKCKNCTNGNKYDVCWIEYCLKQVN